MKKIKILSAIIVLACSINFVSAQGAGGTFFPTTSVYAGDLTTEKFQEKLSIIDAEISKMETKRTAELELLQKSYEDNMPQAPKHQKKDKTVKASKNQKSGYSLIEDINPSTEAIDTVKPIAIEKVSEDNYTEVKAAYDAKYEASKNAIIAKYDALISKYEDQRLKLTDEMVNSKGNFVASTTSAEKAAQLYTSIKYADNLGNNSANGSLNQQGVVVMYVHNNSKYCTVTITSAPFNGITLTPGQKSTVCLPVPIGVYSLAYNEYRNGTSIVRPRTMNIPIALGGGSDLNIFDR